MKFRIGYHRPVSPEIKSPSSMTTSWFLEEGAGAHALL
jgi:hypothetical protein